MKLKLSELKSFSDFFFIAEAGVNHEGSLDKAIKMVEGASQAGASAIKFQAYTADGLAHEKYAKSYWDRDEESESSQYSLFKKFESFSKGNWEIIKNACEENKIEFWLSIFETSLVETLGELCDGIKVASGDITFTRLHEKIRLLNKPTIFSLGASNHDEINQLQENCTGMNYATLMCRLIYPTNDKYANYINYRKMSERYKSIKGISDHCKDINSETILMSFLLGASILEKHFSLDNTKKGNDHYHSCTPNSLSKAFDSLNRIKVLLGQEIEELPIEQELPARKGARRSLYLTDNKSAGETLKEDDLIELRPFNGICASRINKVIGKKLIRDLRKGDPLENNCFD